MKHFKKMMKYTFITIFIVAFLKIAIGVSGFCYDEMRYLSKQEKIDRVLFGDQAHLMLEQEKKEALKERGMEYPDCCKISGQPDGYGLVSWILNPLILNRHFVQLEIYRENITRDPESENLPYYYSDRSVNSCATQSIFEKGMDISKEEYDIHIRKHKGEL